jgi:hypothetical protein
MNRTAVALLTLQLGLATLPSAPLWSQQDNQGTDFWIGVGRFRTSILADAPTDPPDLSGAYQVHGFARPGDTSSAYQTTVTVKRKKIVETPQGAKIAWYQIRYNWDEPVDAVGVHIGQRLYLAYGSKNIALGVGAPMVLTPQEEPAARAARAIQLEVSAANQNYDDNVSHFSKGAPWFSGTKVDGADHFHVPSDLPFTTSGFYALWFNARDTYGHEVMPGLDPWADGTYRITSYNLKKRNEGSHWDVGRFVVAANGENFQIEEQYGYGPNKGSIHGTAHRLEDGTVVWVLGGGENCGAAYYDFVNGALSGVYWIWGGSVTGTETLTPAAEVVARNPTLFAAR